MAYHRLLFKRILFLFLLFAPVALFAAPQKRLNAKECIECHAPVVKEKARKVVHEPFRDEKNCEACHKRHGIVGTLVLKQEQPGLCYSCHKQEEAKFKAAHIHNPVANGKCTKCHNPHSSYNEQLLRASGNNLCFTCHDKAKFSQASVHKPAGERCLTCHDAHAGANERRLITPKAELCGTCHKPGGKGPVPKHGGMTVTGDCTICHSPHSAPEKGLLHAFVHPPVADCATCHQPNSAELTKAQPDLCFDCHSDKQEEMKKKENVHAAFSMSTCTACHSPHTSDYKSLLVSNQKALCLTCHDAIGKEIDAKSHHKPAANGECTSCHAPHSAPQAKLLKARGGAL